MYVSFPYLYIYFIISFSLLFDILSIRIGNETANTFNRCRLLEHFMHCTERARSALHRPETEESHGDLALSRDIAVEVGGAHGDGSDDVYRTVEAVCGASGVEEVRTGAEVHRLYY